MRNKLLFLSVFIIAISFACKKNDNEVALSTTSTTTVTTIAGDVNSAPGSTDGQGAAARFYALGDIEYDPRNKMVYFVDDGNAIRSLDSQNNVATWLPSGVLDRWDVIYGFSLAPGTKAGTLLITTKYNRLYKIEPDGTSSRATLLIDGQGNATGDFSMAQLDGASGITSVPGGKAYIFNTYFNTMHRISFNSATTGIVESFVGKPLVKPQDTAYPFQDGSGETATFGGGVSDISADINGNIYVSDYDRNTIRKVTPQGVVTSLFATQTVAFDKDGPLFKAQAHRPHNVAPDTKGNLYFTTLGLDASGPAIRAIKNNDQMITLAGNNRGYKDGAGENAAFGTIGGIAVTPDGKRIYVADYGNNVIRRIDIK